MFYSRKTGQAEPLVKATLESEVNTRLLSVQRTPSRLRLGQGMALRAPGCRALSWSRSGAGGDADAVLAPLRGGVHSQLAQDVLAHGRPGCEGALEVGVFGVHLRQCSQPCQHCILNKN